MARKREAAAEPERVRVAVITKGGSYNMSFAKEGGFSIAEVMAGAPKSREMPQSVLRVAASSDSCFMCSMTSSVSTLSKTSIRALCATLVILVAVIASIFLLSVTPVDQHER